MATQPTGRAVRLLSLSAASPAERPELHRVYSEGVLDVGFPPTFVGGVPVKDLLNGLSKAIKDISNFIGEVVGGFLGGIAKGVLDAVKDDIEQILGDLKSMAEDLLKYAADQLKDVLDKAFDELNATLKSLVDRVIYVTALVDEIIKQRWEQISEDIIVWLFEANIAAYDAAATLPFARNIPRLVYAKPIWLRAGSGIEPDARLVLRGNFLDKFTRFEIAGVSVAPIDKAGNQLSFAYPAPVQERLETQKEGHFSIIVLASRKPIFSRRINERVGIPVLPKLEFFIEAQLWPKYNHVRTDVMYAEYKIEPTDDDSKPGKEKYDVPRSDATFEDPSIEVLDRNGVQDFRAELGNGRKTFTVSYYLEGEGPWPFEGRVWMHYRYKLLYRWVERDKQDGIQRLVLNRPEDIVEEQRVITFPLAYKGGKELALRNDIEFLRWNYQVQLKVLEYVDGGLAQEQLVRRVDDQRPELPDVGSTVSAFGELLITVRTEAIVRLLKHD